MAGTSPMDDGGGGYDGPAGDWRDFARESLVQPLPEPSTTAPTGVATSLEALWGDSRLLRGSREILDSDFTGWMMARFLHHDPHGGIIFGVLHRLEGQVIGLDG